MVASCTITSASLEITRSLEHGFVSPKIATTGPCLDSPLKSFLIDKLDHYVQMYHEILLLDI